MKVGVFIDQPPKKGDVSLALLTVVAAGGLVLLFGAGRAEATPIVTFKCSPAPQNCSGWYRSNVSIDWERVARRTRRSIGGCQDKTYSDRHAGHERTVQACDDGEATVRPSQLEDAGSTRPLRSRPRRYSRPRAPDVGRLVQGHPVSDRIPRARDQTSGHRQPVPLITYSGPDSGAGSLTGTCIGTRPAT